MILVTVGQQDPPEAGGALGEVVEVGDDRVDARHLGGGEEHPRVEEEDVILPLEHHRVEAELTEPAERDEAHRARLTGTPWIHTLAPAGSLLTALQIPANSTTDSVSGRLDP